MSQFKTLDASQERRLIDSIQEIIDTAGSKASAEQLDKTAADVFSRKGGFTPELVKRACEAYNKSKTVHYLSKTASDKRAEAFPLISPDNVVKAMYGVEKTAESAGLPSMDMSGYALDITELTAPQMEKVASISKVSAADIYPDFVDNGIVDREILRAEERLATSINTVIEHSDEALAKSNMAIDKVAGLMKHMTARQMEKVARVVVNRFNDDGSRLMQVISAKLDCELPIEKTAQTAILPLEPVYTAVIEAMDQSNEYARLRGILNKAAADDGAGAARRTMASLARATSGTLGLGAGVLATGGELAKPVLDFAKLPVYQQMVREEKGKSLEEALDPEMLNKLRELDTTQAYLQIMTDEHIKKYPPKDVTKAFNEVAGALPELTNYRYHPWLKALVRQQLVQGNVIDVAGVEQMTRLRGAMSRSALDEARSREIADELAREKKVIPGLPEAQVASIVLPDVKDTIGDIPDLKSEKESPGWFDYATTQEKAETKGKKP